MATQPNPPPTDEGHCRVTKMSGVIGNLCPVCTDLAEFGVHQFSWSGAFQLVGTSRHVTYVPNVTRRMSYCRCLQACLLEYSFVFSQHVCNSHAWWNNNHARMHTIPTAAAVLGLFKYYIYNMHKISSIINYAQNLCVGHGPIHHI